MDFFLCLMLVAGSGELQLEPEVVPINAEPSPGRVVIEITTTTTIVTTEVEEIPIETMVPQKFIEEKPAVMIDDSKINATVPFKVLRAQPKPPKCYVVRDELGSGDYMDQLSENGIRVLQTYKNNFNGASFCTNDSEIIDKLKKENIRVEDDGIYKISSVQYPISKHLWLMKNYTNSFFNSYFYDNIVFRILQIEKIFRFFKGTYKYYYTGKNTKIYLIDTSVNVRAPNISNISGLKRSCNSHGDINVDLLIDKTRGFARDADITVLDAVDCDGNIKLSEILAVLEIVKKESRPTILLFGVSGQYSEILNDVVDSISSKGVIVIAPAGNNHDNACYHSPSSAKKVLSIGSVNRHTSISKFSNFGSCVRLYSLGQEIYENNNTKGTSHAAATVAGAVAMYLEKFNNANFSDIWAFLDNNSYWNGSYMIFKVPFLSLEYRSQEIKNKESNSSGDSALVYILILIILFVIIFLIYYFISRRRRQNKRRDYIIDSNLRNRSVENQ